MTFTKPLKEIGFKDTDDDPCIFYYNEGIIIGIFVADGIIIGKNENKIKQVGTGKIK